MLFSKFLDEIEPRLC